MKKGISRRDFLKYLGVGAAGATFFAGVSPKPASASAEENLPTFDLPPFKLQKTKETPSTCPYCGCGCSTIVYSDENGKVVFLEGNPDSPINEGTLCPKGSGLPDIHTIINEKRQRVLNP